MDAAELIAYQKRMGQAYRAVFAEGIHAEVVLEDLAQQLYGNDSVFDPTSHEQTLVNVGRREAWLLITSYLQQVDPQEGVTAEFADTGESDE